MQYFAQDEATRLDRTLNVYQTLAGDAPMHMVPSIRNILGGFLFSGDDVDKPVRVLSGGERTRLAVARMLLRPSNTLLLDEPTNHLDLDSKDVLLEALEDFGGTLIFVSHDRYFVDKLATKVIEIGGGQALIYPGSYEEFLWSRRQQAAAASRAGHPPPRSRPARQRVARRASRTPAGAARSRRRRAAGRRRPRPQRPPPDKASAQQSYEERRRDEAEPAASRRRPTRSASGSTSSRRASPIAKGDQGDRGDDVGARLLRRPRRGSAGDRQAPGADVGGRRPDEPVGGAANEIVIGVRFVITRSPHA